MFIEKLSELTKLTEQGWQYYIGYNTISDNGYFCRIWRDNNKGLYTKRECITEGGTDINNAIDNLLQRLK